MAQRATADQLRKPRTTEATINVENDAGEMVPTTFVIAKIKVGQRRRVSAECFDENGIPDLEKASCIAAEMCVVEPTLTAEDIDNIDIDVFLRLADEIAIHSGLMTIAQIVTPDPEEGSDVVKSFPVSE